MLVGFQIFSVTEFGNELVGLGVEDGFTHNVDGGKEAGDDNQNGKNEDAAFDNSFAIGNPVKFNEDGRYLVAMSFELYERLFGKLDLPDILGEGKEEQNVSSD